MRVETIRALPEFAPVRPQVLADNRVAVLLNANARRVDKRVEAALRHVVPSSDLFVSHSLDEARSVARWVVDQRYRTVFSGGGDGTFVTWVNLILDLVEHPSERRSNAMSLDRVPRFGVLRLGTGNALADVVGASPFKGDGLLDDVLRARAGEIPNTRMLDLITFEGSRVQFAGLGFDGAILNDYCWMKTRLGGGPLAFMGTGGMGYFLAVAGRSIPKHLFKRPANVTIVSNGAAQRIGPGGRPIGDVFGPGTVLYQGPVRIAAVSTIPYYGYRFKLFPFAGKRRSMMHLRVSDCGVSTVVANIGKLWDGRFTHPGLHDFYAEDVTLAFDREMPLHVGGDAAGYRSRVRFQTCPRPVEVLDFSAARA